MTSPENAGIADIDLFVIGEDGPETVCLGDLIRGKRAVIFTVPGAFTPTCHNEHMPGFIRNSEAIRAHGVDEIICVTVNDPFVADAWARATDAASAGIRVLADPGAELTGALGIELNAPAVGLLNRAHRCSMLVEDGRIEGLYREDNPGVCEVSSGESLLGHLSGAAA